MTSEWLKVMLDEIARKKAEAEQAAAEAALRLGPTHARAAAAPASAATPAAAPSAGTQRATRT